MGFYERLGGNVFGVRSAVAERLQASWADSRSIRSAVSEPIRALALIAVMIFCVYPSVTALYGVSAGMGLLTLSVMLKPSRSNVFLLAVAGGIGYWQLWLELI